MAPAIGVDRNAARLAVIDVAVQFAQDHQVQAFDQLGKQECGAKVREQLQFAPQRQQAQARTQVPRPALVSRPVDREMACVAMIETAEGIEKMEEIISTPDLDAVYIGPTDLALSLGLPPVMDNDDPKHVATVNRILETCRRHNVVAAMHTTSSKYTQRYIDQGFRMVMLVNDRVAMSNYVKAEVGRLTGWSPPTP